MRSTTSRSGAIALGLMGSAFVAACSGGIPADTVYVNGHVVTVDDDFSIAEAFAVHQGRFVAVGTTTEVRARVTSDTPEIDLEGATVLPGFNDNHIHLGPGRGLDEWRGAMVGRVSEWTRGLTSMDQLETSLAGQVAQASSGEWIRGSLQREVWPNNRIPTRWQLDEVAPDNPVLLTRGPHTYILNSAALRLAGITNSTPDPEGGWIFRDERGRANGRVLEAARRLVDRVAPRSSRRTSYEDGLESMRTMLLDLSSLGITSANISGIRPGGIGQIQDLYDRWGEELPRATMQIRLSPGHDTYDDPVVGIRNSIAELESLGFKTGFGDDRLKLGAVKMSIDGGLSAPVFWSVEPYEGRPDFYGAIRIPADVFYPVAKRAHELGWQLGIHTMGDGAVRMVADQIERILEESPSDDHRHYMHHVAVKPPEETLEKMGRLGIMVASQPSFTVGLGAFAEEALAGEREETQNPTASLQAHGITVSWGSDGAPYGPLMTIWTGVTRRGYDGEVHGPGEAVRLEEALRLHTSAPAYFTFDEGRKGQISVGMLADFIVLSEDILAIDAERIKDLLVEQTFVGGREVYSRR